MLRIDNNHSLFAQINLNRESSMIGITTYTNVQVKENWDLRFFS